MEILRDNLQFLLRIIFMPYDNIAVDSLSKNIFLFGKFDPKL